MGRRGRPPHPGILTPREWEVLALLRDGLTNEAIAERLGITHAAAKYHVSEILSRLGVATREEAAAWRPAPVPPHPWWAAAFVVLRRGWPLAGAAGALAALSTLAVLVLVLTRDSETEPSPGVAETSSPNAIATSTAPPTGAPMPGIPSGPSFAYAAPDGTIWLYDLQREESIPLITEPIGANFDQARVNAKWSPDGQRLAYLKPDSPTGDLSDPGGLRTLDVNTEREQQLAENVYYFEWGPRGRYLLYVDRDDHSTWIVDTESGSQWEMPQGAAYLAWSPDEVRLAYNAPYQVPDDSRYHRARLYLVNVDGSGLTQLTDDGVLLAYPWSPDGRLLAYWKNEEGGSAAAGDLFVIEISTGHEIGLGRFTGDEHPQWAPDSTQLLFHNFRIDLQTGAVQELFPRPGSLVALEPTSGAWSPDGRRVAFIEGYPFGEGPRSLVILDLTTGERKRLHTSEASLAHAGSPGYYGTWSPDGSYFAFKAFESSDSAATPLYVANVSSGEVRLVLGPIDVTQVFATYSPDGTRLLIQNGRFGSKEAGNLPSILLANADGSGLVKLVDGVAIQLTGWRP